tara:strand:+ start:199 stop:561 length:363 start_codon:yes stop_codon:yes gene_type:complete
MDSQVIKLTIANRKKTKKFLDNLISPTIEVINEQITTIISSIQESFNNKEFSYDVLYLHEIGVLLKESLKAEGIVIKCNDKVRSISWFLQYWHDGLANYIKNNTKLNLKYDDNDTPYINL